MILELKFNILTVYLLYLYFVLAVSVHKVMNFIYIIKIIKESSILDAFMDKTLILNLFIFRLDFIRS